MQVPLPAASHPSKTTTVGTFASRRARCSSPRRSCSGSTTSWYSRLESERVRSTVSSISTLFSHGARRIKIAQALLSRQPDVVDGDPEPRRARQRTVGGDEGGAAEARSGDVERVVRGHVS